LWRTYQDLSTESYIGSAILASDTALVPPVATAAAATAIVPTTQTALQSLPHPRRCPTSECNFTFEFPDSYKAKDAPSASFPGVPFTSHACKRACCLQCPVVQGKVGPGRNPHSCQQVLHEIQQSQERRGKLELWKRENAQADQKFQEMLQKESVLRA
jgi:hypothetical protein